MLGSEFINTITKLRIVEYTGVEDFADKMSFLYSVLVLMLCTFIISVKQYLLSAIACYTPTVPSGSEFESFLENYCWVHGTIPLLSTEEIPQRKDTWAAVEDQRINYYQWVPFMLGLQCVLFYLPRLLWQLFCYNRTGSDLENLIHLANNAGGSTGKDRRNVVFHVAKILEDICYQHRDYKKDRIAKIKRTAGRIFGPLFVSKRQGTWLVFTYFLIKVLYLANSFGQLALMQNFLGLNASYADFGIKVANHMLSGRDWRETRLFPRVSYCYVPGIRHLGVQNDYTAQCVLPVNMLNEKVYIFLWFWTTIVAAVTVISIPVWFYRVNFARNRIQFIRKNLKITNIYYKDDTLLLEDFAYDFLRYDGVFLLRMISINAGEMVGAEIIKCLWLMYRKQHGETPELMPPLDKKPNEDSAPSKSSANAPRQSIV